MANVPKQPTRTDSIQPGVRYIGWVGLVLLTAANLPSASAGLETLRLIEVFTDAQHTIQEFRHPVSSLPEVRIYMLDHLHRLESRLSEGLPTDPGLARELAFDRIQKIHETDRARLQQAAVGLARAAHYGIDRYPAMVFNGHAVVYGLTNLEAAWAHYRHWYRP